MSYLPREVPRPEPASWEKAFWDYCRHRTLRFQTCAACGKIRHPPVPFCPTCRSREQAWTEAPPFAELYTYTVIQQANHPALATVVPYNAAVVIFPSLQSVRLVTNIVDCPNEALRIGMKLELIWEEPIAGCVLPRFRPRESSPT